MKTKIVKIHPEYPDAVEIAKCAKVISDGGLVIFPTETVYGIAADFANPDAIKRLKEVKKRSDNKPFSVLISQKGLISNYTSMNKPALYKLIDAFWPGPLTIVLPAKKEGETIGVRMPDHPIALQLTQSVYSPVAAPSANVEGMPPPRTCREALDHLDGLVDVAIDGGEARIGTGSSVVDFTKERPVVLRKGAISQEDIDGVFDRKLVLFVCTGNSCRSVMAEYLLRDLIGTQGDIDIASAGTSVFFQSSASAETKSVLGEEGIDAANHVSQPIGNILLKKADLIFVMTRTHREQVLERAPDVEKRVYLLKEFANIPADFDGDVDIPDPIGRSHEAYKECLGVIKEAVCKIKELL